MVNLKKTIFIGLLFLILDQITKLLVRIFSIQTNTGLIDITFTTNRGSLFSLFSNFTHSNWIFILLSFIAIGVISYMLKDEKECFQRTSYTLILAGILGNLIDRIYLGYVVDWINFHFWPIFNIADSLLVCGVIISIYILIKEEYDKFKKKK